MMIILVIFMIVKSCQTYIKKYRCTIFCFQMEAIKRAIKDDFQRTLNPQQFVKTTYCLEWFATFKMYGLVFYAHYFIILTIIHLIRPLLLLIPKNGNILFRCYFMFSLHIYLLGTTYHIELPF